MVKNESQGFPWISHFTGNKAGIINAMEHSAAFANPRRNVAALGIEHGMRVADFGAGSGAYTLAIATHLSGSGHVIAVDVQRDLLRRIKNEATRRGYKNIDIVWGDLEVPGSSKIADRHLDFVLISNLLFQVEEKIRVLEEARRVLKPSGRLAIIDWADSTLPTKGPNRGRVGPHRREVVSQTALSEMADRVGFIFDREFKAGSHHYGLLFRVK